MTDIAFKAPPPTLSFVGRLVYELLIHRSDDAGEMPVAGRSDPTRALVEALGPEDAERPLIESAIDEIRHAGLLRYREAKHTWALTKHMEA